MDDPFFFFFFFFVMVIANSDVISRSVYGEGDSS